MRGIHSLQGFIAAAFFIDAVPVSVTVRVKGGSATGGTVALRCVELL